MADHEFGEVPHDGFRLHVELTHHFVSPPVSNEADDVVVYTWTEEGHGAFCPKGSCRDVMMRESQMGSRKEFYGGLEVGHDFSGGHVYPAASRWFKTGKRCVSGGVLLSEMYHAPAQGVLGAYEGVSCGPISDFPPSHAIFLSAEGEDHEGGGEVIVGGGWGVEHRAADTGGYNGQ